MRVIGENKCPFPKIYGLGLAFNVILCCAHTHFSSSKSHFSDFPFLMKMTVVRGGRGRDLHAEFFYRFPLISLSNIKSQMSHFGMAFHFSMAISGFNGNSAIFLDQTEREREKRAKKL